MVFVYKYATQHKKTAQSEKNAFLRLKRTTKVAKMFAGETLCGIFAAEIEKRFIIWQQ